jgi:hypothetical protein
MGDAVARTGISQQTAWIKNRSPVQHLAALRGFRANRFDGQVRACRITPTRAVLASYPSGIIVMR